MTIIFIAAAFLLGLLIGVLIMAKAYDGTMLIENNNDDEKTMWTLQYDGDPYEIPKKKSVRFKIKS